MNFNCTVYFKRTKGKHKGEDYIVENCYFDGTSVIAPMKFDVDIRPPYRAEVFIGDDINDSCYHKFIFKIEGDT